MSMKYQFVQGMSDPRAADAEAKMREEADMMQRRVQLRGGNAMRDYQEGAPDSHQQLMQRGRDIAGEFDPAAQIGVSAIRTGERASDPAGDGIDHIGAFAESLLRRARERGARGG
jgi:hypothetical protein